MDGEIRGGHSIVCLLCHLCSIVCNVLGLGKASLCAKWTEAESRISRLIGRRDIGVLQRGIHGRDMEAAQGLEVERRASDGGGSLMDRGLRGRRGEEGVDACCCGKEKRWCQRWEVYSYGSGKQRNGAVFYAMLAMNVSSKPSLDASDSYLDGMRLCQQASRRRNERRTNLMPSKECNMECGAGVIAEVYGE